jgi:hypothetical protein
MSDDKLHRRGEPFLPTGQLISMLDVMGASVTCDRCGNWQRLQTLSLDEARKTSEARGWTLSDGKDLCPECSA